MQEAVCGRPQPTASGPMRLPSLLHSIYSTCTETVHSIYSLRQTARISATLEARTANVAPRDSRPGVLHIASCRAYPNPRRGRARSCVRAWALPPPNNRPSQTLHFGCDRARSRAEDPHFHLLLYSAGALAEQPLHQRSAGCIQTNKPTDTSAAHDRVQAGIRRDIAARLNPRTRLVA